MPTKRKKGKTYFQEWLKKHPRVWLYLTKEEHEYLTNLANKEKKSFKELLLEALKFMKEEYPKLKKEKEQFEKTITQMQAALSGIEERQRAEYYKQFIQQFITDPLPIIRGIYSQHIKTYPSTWDKHPPLILPLGFTYDQENAKLTIYLLTHKAKLSMSEINSLINTSKINKDFIDTITFSLIKTYQSRPAVLKK